MAQQQGEALERRLGQPRVVARKRPPQYRKNRCRMCQPLFPSLNHKSLSLSL